MGNFSARSLNNLKGVHPDLAHVLEDAVKASPIDFTIVSGVRSIEEQQRLYSQGRTTKGSIVTNADGVKNRSNHQAKEDGFGYAVDIYPYYNGSVQVNAPFKMFEEIARHVQLIGSLLGIKIEWGGDWKKFKDAPHLELKK